MQKKLFGILLIFILSLSLLIGCDALGGEANDSSQNDNDNINNSNANDSGNGDSEDKKPSKPEPGDDYDGIDYNNGRTVTVTLEVDKYCSVIGENPKTVAAGEDVGFPVVFKSNYSFLRIEGGENVVYHAGFVNISKVTENTTVKLYSALTSDLYKFEIEPTSPTLGTVELSVTPGNVLKGTVIDITAKPAENQTFIGWSKGGTVVDGGSVVSYSKNYSFAIEENTKLYPNFLTEGYTVIKYDLNGGTTADGTTDIILTQYKPANHLAPNLIADDGKIVRPGYTLLEFTENRDGSGLVVNPGGMTKLPDEGSILTFYAQWSEWTPKENFDYTIDSTTRKVTINSYLADSSTVSIPMDINGYEVTRIAANAFIDKSFEMLVIPKTVKTVDNGAFQNCYNFNTLYITDSFTSIYNNAFIGCKAFSNLRLNASLPPHHVSHAESISSRLEQLLSRDSNKSLIMFVGGSSCLYGIKSEIIEKELGYKYQILNCGTNAGGTGVLYIEGLSHFMREGDIVVNVPEYGANQMGGTEIVWRTFRATVACYNIFRYVDFSKYTNFFTAMTEYNTDPEARYAGKEQTYETKNSSLSAKYCDLVSYKPPITPNNYYTQSIKTSTVNTAKINTINNLYEHLKGLKIDYYFSCAPVCYYNAKGTISTSDQIEAYQSNLVSKLKCPVISTPMDYLYDAAADYNNSNYHLCTDAANRHTEKIAADLKAALE